MKLFLRDFRVLTATLFVTVCFSASADNITGTGWKGTAGNSNFSSTGNWDNDAPNTSGSGDRNLFFGQGFKKAGATGSTSPNVDLSGWHGYRLTFQDSDSTGTTNDGSAANDTAFIITGNSFGLYDFSSTDPKIENDSYLTQTFTLTSGQTLTLDGNNGGAKAEVNPVNGNIVFSQGTKIDLHDTTQLQVWGNNGNTVTFNDVISSIATNNSVAINQNSVVVFAATNVYAGDTFINAGTLRCATNSAVTNNSFIRLGDVSGSVGANLNLDGGLNLAAKINVRFGSSGTKVIANTLSTAGTATYSGNVFLDTNVTLFANSGGSVTLSGTTIDLKNQTLTVDGSGSSTISGGMTNSTGTGKLIKTGSGTLTISGSNAYIGGTTIKNGTVVFSGSTTITGGPLGLSNSAVNLGDISGTTNATLTHTGSAIVISYPVTVQFGSSGVKTLADVSSASVNYSSNIVLNDSVTLDPGNSGNIILNAPVTGSGGINKVSSGLAQLNAANGANTFAGNITISQGSFQLGSASAVPNGSGKGIVTLNPTSPNTATFDLHGNNQTINGLTSTGTGSAVVDNISSLSKTITVGTNTSNPNGTFAGVIQNSSSGTLGLTKAGSGTLTLTGKSTYSGATTVSGGTLLVNGGSSSDSSSGTGSSAVSVSSTATLGGTGRIAGNVTFNSSALAVFTQGSPLTIGGTLTLNANVVHLNLPSNLGAGTYTLATYTASGSSGAFNSTPVVDSGSFASGTTSAISTSGGNVNLVVKANSAFSGLTASQSINYGATSVTLSGKVSASGPIYPANGETITVTINGNTQNTTVNDSTGDFSIAYNPSTIPYAAGAYTIAYSYAGNASLNSTSDASTALTVNKLAANLSGTRAYDGTTNATASILSVANAVNSDNVTVASGVGGLAGKNVGSQAITSLGTIALGGTAANNYTVSGASGSVTITQAVTSIAIVSSENPSGFKDSVGFTANNLPADATGNIIFRTNNVLFDTEALSSGVATSVTTTNLPRGTNSVTAEYAGDSNYLGSTNSLTQTVTNHPPMAVTLTVTRTAGLNLLIPLSSLATNWTDADGDTVELTSVNSISTNSVSLSLLNAATNNDGSYIITNTAYIGYPNSTNVADQFTYAISDGFGGTNTGLVNIIITSGITGQAQGLSISGNTATLSFAGIPNYSYGVQRSTNLTDWVTICSTNAPAGGVFSVTDNFSDLGSNAPPSAYYRLSWSGP